MALVLLFGNPAAGSPFEATLGVHVPVWGLPGAFFTGSGPGTSSASSVTLPSSVFSGVQQLMLTPGQAPPLTRIRVAISGNGAGSFAGTPFGGPLGVGGHLALQGFGATLLSVPFATPMGAGVGVGGTGMAGGSVVILTLRFAEWATGAYTSLSGRVFQGLDSRTPAGLGQITLVSPTRVETTVAGDFSIVSTLTLTFVPEPATLLLLGAGVAGLAWQGQRRSKR